MLQNSLFSSSMADAVEPVAIPEAQTTAKANRRRNAPLPIEEISNPQSNQKSSRKAQIIADAQTPILDRYAPHEVIPLTEFLEVCQEVDRRLAKSLEASTTAADVVLAFAAEPYACYGEAVRLIEEEDLLKKIAADLRSLTPTTALYQLAQLPLFLQEKVWARFTPQEHHQLAQVSQRMQGGQQ